MKALSVRAPWWWFILHGGKDIENRDWATSFRGKVCLHTSKWWRVDEISADSAEARQRCYDLGRPISQASFPTMRAAGGHLVGTVDIVDCVTKSGSPWFSGEYGFVLANPVAFATPVPCKGALGFFTVPDEVLAQLSGVQGGDLRRKEV